MSIEQQVDKARDAETARYLESLDECQAAEHESIGYRAERLKALMSDPAQIFEILGPDGLYALYPKHIQRLKGKAYGEATRPFDDYYALQLGRAFMNGDRQAFCRLVWEQFTAQVNYLLDLEE